MQIRSELFDDSTHRIRNLRALIAQIRRDYADLDRLVCQINHHGTDNSILEEIEKRISWLRSGLGHLNNVRGHYIEGVSWIGLDRIEKDIDSKEKTILQATKTLS
jgi:hypothetical protein